MDHPSRDGPSRRPTVPVDSGVLDVLGNERRRAAVRILRERGRLPLRELAEAVLGREGDPTPDESAVEAAELTLYHSHLPKLDDAGLVAFDPDRRVARFDPSSQATVVLDQMLE